jgi:hypothetical protein
MSEHFPSFSSVVVTLIRTLSTLTTLIYWMLVANIQVKSSMSCVWKLKNKLPANTLTGTDGIAELPGVVDSRSFIKLSFPFCGSDILYTYISVLRIHLKIQRWTEYHYENRLHETNTYEHQLNNIFNWRGFISYINTYTSDSNSKLCNNYFTKQPFHNTDFIMSTKKSTHEHERSLITLSIARYQQPTLTLIQIIEIRYYYCVTYITHAQNHVHLLPLYASYASCQLTFAWMPTLNHKSAEPTS